MITLEELQGVPALTVCQPWAWAIAIEGAAGKDVENRTWSTDYRGVILIHAGLSKKFLGSLDCREYPGCPVPPAADDMVYGAFVAAARVVGCVRNSRSLWAETGCWHWQLADRVALRKPVPAKGKQGLWFPEWSLVGRVAVELGAFPAERKL